MASKDPEIKRQVGRIAALTRWGYEREARALRAEAARRRARRHMEEAERLERESAALAGDDAA